MAMSYFRVHLPNDPMSRKYACLYATHFIVLKTKLCVYILKIVFLEEHKH